MAINTTWKVTKVESVKADGGITSANWELVAASDGSGGETATDGGKCKFTYDASDSGFIAFDSVTEAKVLSWIRDASKNEGETATEWKTRIETERTAKVQKQIDAKAANSDALPWS
jgi:hypothetical protein